MDDQGRERVGFSESERNADIVILAGHITKLRWGSPGAKVTFTGIPDGSYVRIDSPFREPQMEAIDKGVTMLGRAIEPKMVTPLGSSREINDYLRTTYPQLYVMSENYDRATMMGHGHTALEQEADAAMHELWVARMNLQIASDFATERWVDDHYGGTVHWPTWAYFAALVLGLIIGFLVGHA